MAAPHRPLRIALFAEAVTLAHVARPIALARAIAPAGHQLLLACDPRYAAFTCNGPWQQRDVFSIPSAQFNSALARGKPVYDLNTLDAYVQQDLQLIKAFEPDVVVGDFRLSLSVSARLAGVPYIAIANAYWTPYYKGGYELPVIPLSRALPIPMARALFQLFRPLAFIPHCRAMNRLRARYGLPSLGNNLRRVYSDADHVMVPDLASLYPLDGPADKYSRIAPLTWSPTLQLPDWWGEPITEDLGAIYVSLGSSGDSKLLPMILKALESLPVRVFASTAGAPVPASIPANARLASYLPGDAVAQRSRLMISNGGSLASVQAITAGIPMLGIASNMDQFLNMRPIEERGAGITLRADRLTIEGVRQTVQTLLNSTAAAAAANRLMPMLHASPPIAATFESAASRLITARH